MNESSQPQPTMRRQILPYDPRLKEYARQLRKKMPLAEILLWKHLRGKQMCGYDFDRQRGIGEHIVGEHIVDFYCKDLMLAIEVDGSTHDQRRREDEMRQRRLEA